MKRPRPRLKWASAGHNGDYQTWEHNVALPLAKMALPDILSITGIFRPECQKRRASDLLDSYFPAVEVFQQVAKCGLPALTSVRNNLIIPKRLRISEEAMNIG